MERQTDSRDGYIVKGKTLTRIQRWIFFLSSTQAIQSLVSRSILDGANSAFRPMHAGLFSKPNLRLLLHAYERTHMFQHVLGAKPSGSVTFGANAGGGWTSARARRRSSSARRRSAASWRRWAAAVKADDASDARERRPLS